MVYQGDEHFIENGNEIDLTIQDFWRWSYPNFLKRQKLLELSRFIVASSIGISSDCPQDILTRDGLRIRVASASYLQSEDGDHPDQVSYSVVTEGVDAFVICLYKATSYSQNLLNLDLWDFFTISSKTLRQKIPGAKSVTLPRLVDLGVWLCDYHGIAAGIQKAMDV